MVSDEPPAGQGLMICTGRAGQTSCAEAFAQCGRSEQPGQNHAAFDEMHGSLLQL
jgi:hypothetical protein